jgi:hypothetical protein
MSWAKSIGEHKRKIRVKSILFMDGVLRRAIKRMNALVIKTK